MRHSPLTAAFLCWALLLGTGCETRRSPQGDSRDGPLTEAKAAVPVFDPDSAFSYLIRQTASGPRNPGSDGHAACLRYLSEQSARFADSVALQEFTHRMADGTVFTGTNVIARFRLDAGERLIVSAHWDTRPWSDEDPDPAKRALPILGANDGASGAAVLLEVARQLSGSPPPIGIDLIFFDLEDLGTGGVMESWSLGARHFARNLPSGAKYRFGVNIDMIGDKNLLIRREENSQTYAPSVVRLLFTTAATLGLFQFMDEPGEAVFDDHIPLNQASIPTANLIDFDYPDESNRYWHTSSDTPDKCSPESLQAVGTLLLHIIYGQESFR